MEGRALASTVLASTVFALVACSVGIAAAQTGGAADLAPPSLPSAAPAPPPPGDAAPAGDATSAGDAASAGDAELAAPDAAVAVPAARAVWVEPPPEAPPELTLPARFGGRAYVARYALRPMTVGEGVLRIDNGSAGRIGGPGGFGIVASVALGAHLGITDDVEVGFSWSFGSLRPNIYDPVFTGTLRFFHDTAIDVGVRTSVRAPIVTNGDTVWRLGVPVVIRGGNWFRITTALDMDLLFASNVSPMLSIPLQVSFSTGDGFSLGPEAWFAVLDGGAPAGSVGGFAQITHRTPLRALLDVRLAMAYLLAESAVQITTAVSFYPQLW